LPEQHSGGEKYSGAKWGKWAPAQQKNRPHERGTLKGVKKKKRFETPENLKSERGTKRTHKEQLVGKLERIPTEKEQKPKKTFCS